MAFNDRSYKNDHRQYTIITKVVIVDIKHVNGQQ